MSKNFKIFFKSIDFKILLVAFLISFFLRTYYLSEYAVSFAFDQARDAFVASEIVNGDFKILGASVSGIPGLYHGVLYYYFLAPLYALGQGSPITVAFVQSFLNSFGVFIAYWFCFLITKKSTPSLIAAFIFAFSFETSQYANLLSNPAMAVWFVPLTYIGLYLWINTSLKVGPLLTGLFLGLSIQSNIALTYHLVPIVIWLAFYRKKVNLLDICKSGLVLLFAVSTMLLSEVKFGYKGISGIIYLFTHQDGISQSRGLLEIFEIYFRQVMESFANNIFPITNIGGLIGLLIIVFSFVFKTNSRNEKVSWNLFLLSGIAPQIVALPFGGTNMRHIMVGSSVGIAVFISIFLFRLLSKKRLLLFVSVFLILSVNLKQILSENRHGQTIFPLQRDLTLKNELAAVDYTYEASGGLPFSINTITSPLWINTLWSYLYNWQVTVKYHYLPTWSGKNQVGQAGNNLKSGEKVSFSFLIIEPTYGIPEKFIKETVDDENFRTKILEERHFGDIIVQKREPLVGN